MKCKYETCESEAIYNGGIGYCQKHYLRHKNGTLNIRDELNNILYLGEDVDSQRYKPLTYEIDENGCWNITSHYKDNDGYGNIKRTINGKVYKKAHRAVFAYYNDKLYDYELIRHLCDNPSCVNPKHLKKGSHYENMQDRKNNNTYITRNGTRKLNDGQVLSIIDLNKRGKKTKEISEILNINENTIRDILKGRTWSYLTKII